MSDSTILHAQILDVVRDFGIIDFLPHPHDVIRHKCGAVTTFGETRETTQGVMVTASTLLPSPIASIQIEGTLQL